GRHVAERGAEGLRLGAGGVILPRRAGRRRRLARIHVVVAPDARRRGRLREVVAGRGPLGVAQGAGADVLREADAGDGRPRAGAAGTVAVGAAGYAGQRAAGARLDLLGEHRRLVLVADDLVRGADRAVDDAREVLAVMDAVDHLLQL